MGKSRRKRKGKKDGINGVRKSTEVGRTQRDRFTRDEALGRGEVEASLEEQIGTYLHRLLNAILTNRTDCTINQWPSEQGAL